MALALAAILQGCGHNITETLEAEEPVEAASCLDVDIPAESKNAQEMEEARSRLLDRHPELGAFLPQHEAQLDQAIRQAFEGGMDEFFIANLSSYDYLFQNHLPKKYSEMKWDKLPRKIQRYMSYLRFVAAQKIYHYAQNCDVETKALTAGHLMGVQQTDYSPKEALESAYDQYPFKQSYYVPPGIEAMNAGSTGHFHNGRLVVDGRYQNIESFAVMVGGGMLHLDPESYEGLQLKNVGFVSGEEGLFVFAQPKDEYWCGNNLIVMKVNGGGGGQLDSAQGKASPGDRGDLDLPRKASDGLGKAEAHVSIEPFTDRRKGQSSGRGNIKISRSATSASPGNGQAPIKAGGGSGSIATAKKPGGEKGTWAAFPLEGKGSKKTVKSGRKWSSSGGHCNPEDWTREGDPFDRLREATENWQVEKLPGIPTRSNHDLCLWLQDKDNFEFVVGLTGVVPPGKLYYSWKDTRTCQDNWRVETKNASCIALQPDSAEKGVRLWFSDTGQFYVHYKASQALAN